MQLSQLHNEVIHLGKKYTTLKRKVTKLKKKVQAAKEKVHVEGFEIMLTESGSE